MIKQVGTLYRRVDVNMGGKVGEEIMYAMYHLVRDQSATTYCVGYNNMYFLRQEILVEEIDKNGYI